MAGAARVTDQHSHGGYLLTGSGDVRTDGLGNVRLTDTAWCPKHGTVQVIGGSGSVMTNGMNSARFGDYLTCGAQILTGSGTRDVGDSTGGAPQITVEVNGVTIQFTEVDLGSEMDDPDSNSSGMSVYPPIGNGTPTAQQVAQNNALVGTDPAPTPVTTDTIAGATVGTTPASCVQIASPLDYTQQLSASWKLSDVTTNTAISRKAIVAQHGLTEAQIACNLMNLCVNVLEPLSQKFGRAITFATSGFRTGSSTSQHELGMAADIQFTDQRTGLSDSDYWARVQWVKENLPYDQFIIEYIGMKPWMHLSYNSASQRRQLLTAVRSGGKVTYQQGLQRLS